MPSIVTLPQPKSKVGLPQHFESAPSGVSVRVPTADETTASW